MKLIDKLSSLWVVFKKLLNIKYIQSVTQNVIALWDWLLLVYLTVLGSQLSDYSVFVFAFAYYPPYLSFLLYKPNLTGRRLIITEFIGLFAGIRIIMMLQHDYKQIERIAQTIQLQIAHILIMHLIIVLVRGVCLNISGMVGGRGG